ncbi:MAG: M23 family metallopeptidase [Planctomycetota bacterium]
MMTFRCCAVLFGISCCAVAGGQAVDVDRGGFVAGGSDAGPPPALAQPCIPPARRAELERFMLRLDAQLPGDGPASAARPRAFPLFEFYPIGGDIYGDLFINNYTDLNGTAPGVLDWDCSNHTYHTHRGHDVGLKSFEEQFIGVPIFAALPGTVIDRDDGHFDQNTVWAQQPANFVVIDHGDIEPGLRTFYWHMRNGSVLPQIGDRVEAGQQIGLVASSGNSDGPHLHFEVWRNGSWVETMSGPCSPFESMWANQWQKPTEHYTRDFGFFRELFDPAWQRPEPFPRDRAVTLDTDRVTYWTMGNFLPQDTTYRFRFYMPGGQLDFDSGTRPLGFTSAGFSRFYWAFFYWNIADMQRVPGVWTVAFDLNGVRQVTTPITVLDDGENYVNQPPLPVFPTLEPANPDPDDAIVARINSDLVIDDIEHDLVRYRYTWTIDGVVVRDVISAGHADMIPSVNAFGGGSAVRVDVTPSDGTDEAITTAAEVTVSQPCPADTNGDGQLSPNDFNAWILAFNNQSPACDQNGDGDCRQNDFNAWILNFNAGC